MKRADKAHDDGMPDEHRGDLHDIFLRAHAVVADKKKKRKRRTYVGDDPKWSESALVFDTESRITADQSLTFGVYQTCKLVADGYKVTEEGIFHADDLPAKERKALATHISTAVSDVKAFPPRFPVYSRSQFIKRVFWPAIKRDGALVCGLNIPFDLARLALDWTRGDKGEWSLTMSQYPDGNENQNRPRILITPIDSKKAFIALAKPWKPEEWKDGGKAHFLDLRTLAWALFNKSFSLKTLCEELKSRLTIYGAAAPFFISKKCSGTARLR
jgi:hypothetical protein